MRFVARLLCPALLCALSSGAAVEWQQRHLILHPPLGAAETSGIFEFVNTGTEPVRVIDVQAGCGCTAALMDEEVVAPGETGRLRATFQIGNRRGHQTVALRVTTREPAMQTHDLQLEVEIPEALKVSPRFHYWRVGEDLATKEFAVMVSEGLQLRQAVSLSEHFAAELIQDGGETPTLRVIPRATTARRVGTIRLIAETAEGAVVESQVLVRVL